MEHRAYLKRFYSIAVGGICVLLALVWLLVMHHLSRQGFTAAVSIWWIAMFATFFVLIRRRQRSVEAFRKLQIASGIPIDVLDRDRCLKNIRSSKWLIAAFGIFMAYGLMSTQGKPMTPRLAGAAFDILVIALCANTLFKSKKRLQQIESNSAGEASA
jgi:hypothetical protein